MIECMVLKYVVSWVLMGMYDGEDEWRKCIIELWNGNSIIGELMVIEDNVSILLIVSLDFWVLMVLNGGYVGVSMLVVIEFKIIER